MRSVRSCASTRIPRPRRGVPTSRRSSRERSRWSASSETSQGSGSHPSKKAVVYVPTSAAMPRTSLIARVHGDPELARQTLLNRLTTIDPNMARQVATMRTLARMDTYFLQIAFWLTVVLGGLAAGADAVGPVQRAVVPRRAAHQGNRRADGARCDHATMSRGWSCRSRSGPSASASSSAAVQPPDWPRCCWPRRPPPPLARSFTSSIRSPTP